MELVLKAGKLKRKRFKLGKHTERLIKEISQRYSIPEERIVLNALEGHRIKKDEDEELKVLRDEIDSLLEEMFALEGKWASIRYRSHTYVKENRGLAIILSGYLGENKSLRNFIKKERAHRDMEEVVDYYLWL